jgi:hypothetical protein
MKTPTQVLTYVDYKFPFFFFLHSASLIKIKTEIQMQINYKLFWSQNTKKIINVANRYMLHRQK